MRGVLFLIVWAVVTAAPALAQLRGTMETRSFVDEESGRTVSYVVYLPEGYVSSGGRYPVVYHLHGLGGSHLGAYSNDVPRAFEAAEDAGVLGPVIIVFPNGYEDAWWADSVNSPKPAETDVMARLVPHVDANFRTLARPGSRVIQGFSMGGFGAMKFYAKFREEFAACIEYDGAMYPWSTFRLLFFGLAAEIFDNSSAVFDEYSPWWWTDSRAEELRDGPPIRMVSGLLGSANRSFRDHLLARGIPVEYVQASCGHDLGCLLEEEGMASAAFIAAHLAPVCAADHTGDGVVDSQDFFAFLTDFFAASAEADFNGDGGVDSQDFFDFLGALFGGC